MKSLKKSLLLLTILIALSKADLNDPVEEILDATNLDTSSELFNTKQASSVIDVGVEKSFIISLLMIIVSEIGDKTFLIAAIMAMKHSRLVVFMGAFSSLAIMSILSAFMGHVVPNLIPKKYTDMAAAILFLIFGLRMMYEAYVMDKEAGQEEIAEVEEELKTVEDRERAHQLESMEVGGSRLLDDDQEEEEGDNKALKHNSTQEKAKEGLVNLMQLVFSPIFVQTFVLTFLGEWGDRSQISTIALAAANNVYYVTMGVVLGHGFCTALAVIGGRMLASKISVKTVTFAGSILFIIFGIFYGINAYRILKE
ncbi:uncharacterized protein BX663DRAFT_524687 [Cokeromyces recurvatus]|uniref:uncharacterized protein n=1 Tax=Cokeromyces recurvatus TaxID=90255 RepID=UPI00221EF4C7|nr:uncharacterized protein BX663DRAFT_524687 [Cokeromyces recurvatus]KAI7898586.1 hypothetical protein BX663DRAFT_524687 [Cokeromyces recurvatus]